MEGNMKLDILDEDIRYLNNINDFPHVGLIYYPNSGENIIRKALEMIFKIKTQINIKEEYLNDSNNKVFPPTRNDLNLGWITATDYPLRELHEYESFDISLGIVIVRNPVDVLTASIFKGKIILENEMNELSNNIEKWQNFYKYWIKAPIPIYIIKYEEFLENPTEILKELSKFILGLDSIDNSKICNWIDGFKINEISDNYFPYNTGISFNDNSNKNKIIEISNKIGALDKIMAKLLYIAKPEQNRLSKILNNNNILYYSKTNWLKDFNKESIEKSKEIQNNITESMFSSNYIALKIG